MIKEFDIQKNNPFEKLNLRASGKTKQGGTIYSLSEDDAKSIKQKYKLGETFPVDAGAKLITYNKVTNEHGFAVITYSTIVSSDGEMVEKMRSSEVVVLNNRGEEVFALRDLDHDVISLTVASNGKYIAFSTGEYL